MSGSIRFFFAQKTAFWPLPAMPQNGRQRSLQGKGVVPTGGPPPYNDQAICYPPSEALVSNPSQTGIISISTQGVRLYPNPAKEEVNIALSTGIFADRAEIVNLSGQTVAAHDIADGSRYINMTVANFPPGIYFVKIKEGRKTVQVEKLAVQR